MNEEAAIFNNLDARAHEAYRMLCKHRDQLSPQQKRTIKGQILSGDAVGALKGLKKLLGGKMNEC